MSNIASTTVPARIASGALGPLGPDSLYAPGALILGKYRLESCLGEGGMATVWLARNVLLDVPVALKLMSPAINTPETVERFFVEARVQAKLKHPNIGHVFDFGHTELGDPFIVMEMLQGVTLRDFILEHGPLQPAEAVQLMLPVIGALCHAHEHGVVHRDLKPENIFLDSSDVVLVPKLLDFGIAKIMQGTMKQHATQSGALLGSPSYMAPEQAQGLRNVDHRADIWAACVVLHELVTGRLAFPGNGIDVLRKVVEDVVPPLPDTGEGERALSRILARGLQKQPRLRQQSMRELGTALAQWLCDRGEAEDLHGNRISRIWKVVAPEAAVEDLADARVAKKVALRRIAMPRLLLVAAVVLAGIALPSKLSIEAAVGQDRIAAAGDSVHPVQPAQPAADRPATETAALVELAERQEAAQLLTHSVAMPGGRARGSAIAREAVTPRDEPTPAPEPRERRRSVPQTVRANEADLGLKEAY